jgi:hypothetical protein
MNGVQKEIGQKKKVCDFGEALVVSKASGRGGS